MGWRTPCSRIDAESSWSVSSSNARRGCSGFDAIWSTGIIRTPPRARPWRSFDSRLTMAGESSLSSESRRAAAARKSVLAKFDHLPGKLSIRSRRFGLARVHRDRSADERRFPELHRVADDRVEDVVVADGAELIEHVACEFRPAVVERRQEAEDLQAAVQLETDRVDD